MPEVSLIHDGHGLPHQPDRTAREITMDLVSPRVITGDVARLVGCCEKATGAHEGKKEGRKQRAPARRLGFRVRRRQPLGLAAASCPEARLHLVRPLLPNNL
jgi:hypothetical protein